MALFMDIDEIPAAVEERQKRRKQQYAGIEIVPRGISEHAENEFLRRRFRFTRAGINFITDIVNDDLAKIDQRGAPTPVQIQILVCLKYLASDNFQLDVSDRLKISQGHASNIIYRVSKAIVNHAGRFIFFPRNAVELNSTIRGFFEASGFPSVLGAIDCTHVLLRSNLPNAEEVHYVNRKGNHTINVQAIIDSNYRFIQIDANWPGSSHDAHILRNSNVWHFYENEQDKRHLANSLIIGDSGYPLRSWLLVPFLAPKNNSEMRVKVEQTFGQFKRMFFVNAAGYRLSLARVPVCILASMILFNISKNLNMPAITDDELDEELGGINWRNILRDSLEDVNEPIQAADDPENVHDNAEIPLVRQRQISERQRRLAGIQKRNELVNNRFTD